MIRNPFSLSTMLTNLRCTNLCSWFSAAAVMKKGKCNVTMFRVLTVQTVLLNGVAGFYDLESPYSDSTFVYHLYVETCWRRSPFNPSNSFNSWIPDTEFSDRGFFTWINLTYSWKDAYLVAIVVLNMMTFYGMTLFNFPLDVLFVIMAAPTQQSLMELSDKNGLRPLIIIKNSAVENMMHTLSRAIKLLIFKETVEVIVSKSTQIIDTLTLSARRRCTAKATTTQKYGLLHGLKRQSVRRDTVFKIVGVMVEIDVDISLGSKRKEQLSATSVCNSKTAGNSKPTCRMSYCYSILRVYKPIPCVI